MNFDWNSFYNNDRQQQVNFLQKLHQTINGNSEKFATGGAWADLNPSQLASVLMQNSNASNYLSPDFMSNFENKFANQASLMRDLAQYTGRNYDLSPIAGRQGDVHRNNDMAKYLSDWLGAYSGISGLQRRTYNEGSTPTAWENTGENPNPYGTGIYKKTYSRTTQPNTPTVVRETAQQGMFGSDARGEMNNAFQQLVNLYSDLYNDTNFTGATTNPHKGELKTQFDTQSARDKLKQYHMMLNNYNYDSDTAQNMNRELNKLYENAGATSTGNNWLSFLAQLGWAPSSTNWS